MLGLFCKRSPRQCPVPEASQEWLEHNFSFLVQRLGEWGYALALFARLRREKDPHWIQYLTRNIRSDFSKSQAYFFSNSSTVR